MKVIGLVVALSFFLPLKSWSGQRSEVGAKVGFIASSVYGGSRDASMDFRTGILGGIYYTASITSELELQAEIQVAARSFSRVYATPFFNGTATFTETDKITYLEVPLLIKFPFPFRSSFRPSLYFGIAPAIRLAAHADASYVLSGDQVIPNGSFSTRISNSKWFDVGPLVGGDLSFKIRSHLKVHTDFRFCFGLQNMFRDDANFNTPQDREAPVIDVRNGHGLKLKNTGFSITLGIGWL